MADVNYPLDVGQSVLACSWMNNEKDEYFFFD